MVMIPPDCTPVRQLQEPAHVSGFEKILRLISVLTMLMTVPQVLAVWVAEDVGGVSLISWAAYLFSAVLWFIYGVQKRDKTIYLACVGWVLLDSAVVVGVVVHS